MDWQALSVSIWLGIGTLVVLLPAGLAIGHLLATRRFAGRGAIEALVAVPLVLPPTVLGYYLLVAFGVQSPFGSAFERLFGQALAFSFPGLLVASAIANIPFVVQPIQRGFEAVPTDIREAAACCGLSPWHRFRRIDVPLAWPSILTAAILAFAHTLGEFGVVLMVGGNIPGKTRVISIEIFTAVETLDYATAHILSAWLLVFSFMALTLVYIFNRRGGARLG